MAEFDIKAVFKVKGDAKLNASFKKLNKAVGNVGKSFKQLGSDAAKFGRSVALIGTAGAAAVLKIVDVSKDFEDSFTNVVTLLDETSFATKSLSEGIAGLRDGVLDVGKATGQGLGDLNKALFDINSAGIKADDSISALKDAADLATAGATNVAASVKALTATTTAFGTEAGNTRQIAEKFFTAQKFGVTTVEELGENFNKVAGLAKTLGISFDETLASATALTANGAKPTAQAFTELKAVINATLLAQKKSAKFGAAVQKAISLENIERIGLVAAVRETSAALGGNIIKTQELFGSVEAVSAILSLTGAQVGLYDKLMVELGDDTKRAATFTEALSVKQKTLAFQQNRFNNIVKATVVSLGDALTPAFKEFVDILGIIIEKIGPDLEVFFKSLGGSAVEFFAGFREDLPSTIEGVKGFGKSLESTFTSIGAGFKAVSVAVRALLVVFDTLAVFIPGLDGKALALFVVIGQLTGGFSLIASTIRALFAVFKLFDAALVTSGVLSTTLGAKFKASMILMATSAVSNVKKIIPRIIALGASMTTVGGIMKIVGGLAKIFWRVLLPGGIIVAAVIFISDLIAKFLGFKGIIDVVSKAFDFLKKKFFAFTNAVAKFFGGGKKELDIDVNVKRTTTDQQANGLPQGLARGGSIHGPGSSTSDSIPAMLSNGEYVIKASSVRRLGTGFMDMINNGVIPNIKGFADGGLVDALNSSTAKMGAFAPISSLNPIAGGPIKSGRPLNLILPSGEVIRTTTDENTAERLQKNLRRADSVKSSQLPSWY